MEIAEEDGHVRDLQMTFTEEEKSRIGWFYVLSVFDFGFMIRL